MREEKKDSAFVDPIRVLNTSCETVPPLGVMEICGVSNGVVSIRKPLNSNILNVLFNGPISLLPGLEGVGTRTFPSSVLINDKEINNVTVGGLMRGVRMCHWELKPNQIGFELAAPTLQGFALAQLSGETYIWAMVWQAGSTSGGYGGGTTTSPIQYDWYEMQLFKNGQWGFGYRFGGQSMNNWAIEANGKLVPNGTIVQLYPGPSWKDTTGVGGYNSARGSAGYNCGPCGGPGSVKQIWIINEGSGSGGSVNACFRWTCNPDGSGTLYQYPCPTYGSLTSSVTSTITSTGG